MDKQENKKYDGVDEKTKIIDLSDANVKEEWSEDIDTLYEENEVDNKAVSDEPTRIIPKQKSKKKNKKNKSKPSRKSEKDEEVDLNKDEKPDKEADKKAEKKAEKEKLREEQLKEKNSKKLEKLMKKKKKREEHSDREVLSYEDMPLEEREKIAPKKPKKSGKKRIIAVILLLVVLFGVVFFIFSSDKLSWHNIRNYVKYGILNQKSDEQFPISVQGENVDLANFVRMGQDICFASDTKLQIINNYGRVEYATQHGFTNPVLKADNRYLLVYSLGGTGYQVNEFDKMLYTGETEERIVTGDVIDRGIYALVTTGNGYLSKLHVYNKENEAIFGYSFADYYVTSVSLAPNGKGAVVTGISALNGTEISCLYVLDFTKDKPLYQEEVDNNIFYECEYLDDSHVCAVGNGAASGINTSSGEINTLQYEGKSLTCYYFNSDTDTYSVSLSRSGDGRNCEIYSFNADGTVSSSFETEYMVKYISTYKGRIALLTPEFIALYNKDGGKVSDSQITNEPRAAVLYTSSDAYVLDTNEISVTNI